MSYGGVYIEKFLPGREYTVLIVGDKVRGTKVYMPIERAFNESLCEDEMILSHDQYWAGCEVDQKDTVTGSKKAESFCKFVAAPENIRDMLKDLTRDAYLAIGGVSYARVDIRTNTRDLNAADFKAFVLEVNGQCTISFDSETSSMGKILHLD